MPGIHAIFVCPNLKVRDALIRVISETDGPTPVLRSDSASAMRAHYLPEPSKTIINSPAAMMTERLGKHHACIALEVRDRWAAAEKAVSIFKAEGFEARAHHDVQPEYPKGLLSFVVVPALEGVILMYWPRPEDVTPEMIPSMPPRMPWTQPNV